MKLVVDSDIFINHLRTGNEAALLAALARRSLCYMSSVVALELRAGCRTAQQARFLKRLLDPFERTGRIVYPNHRAWMRAGAILSRIGLVDASKRQSLVHDTLIALGAFSIGASVVSSNRRDFELLSNFLSFTIFSSIQEALEAES